MPEALLCKPPIVVFSDDWGRHPSSCQHLIGKLLGHREVIWVNTIGTRPPRFDWQTVRRVTEKLKQWTRKSAPAPTAKVDSEQRAPRIVSPKMWPSFKGRFARGLNRRLLKRALKPIFESLREPPIVVSTLPLITDLIGEIPANRWVYYCVDDFGVWPGYDGVTMRLLERDFVAKADEIIAVSETLNTHLTDLGRDSHLLTHGVDFDFWNRVDPQAIPEEFRGLEAPWTVFWGVIDRRMDLDFVKELSAKLSRGTLVLFGPQDDPDPMLFQLPRVVVKPSLPFARLPSIAAAASVLVMPYADLPVTRAMQPLKFKEYLATGKPVVVRGLPSTYGWADACDVCDTKERFVEAVNTRIAEGILPTQPFGRERLAAEGWDAKAKQFEAWLDGP
jgi:glycosyltransferase involved in cell wall biosynthesis